VTDKTTGSGYRVLAITALHKRLNLPRDNVCQREDFCLVLMSSITPRKLDKKTEGKNLQKMDEGQRHKTDFNLLCHLPGSTVHKIATQVFVTLNRPLSRVQLSDY
jgi:hypothetical protein